MDSSRDRLAKFLMANPGKQFTAKEINDASGSTEGTRRFREIRGVDYRFHSMKKDDGTWVYWFK